MIYKVIIIKIPLFIDQNFIINNKSAIGKLFNLNFILILNKKVIIKIKKNYNVKFKFQLDILAEFPSNILLSLMKLYNLKRVNFIGYNF